MSMPRTVALASAAVLALALAPGLALAQVCMGIPADEGQISLQGEIVSDGSINSYGGRLGLNFNTEFAFDIAVRRPQYDHGLGTVLHGVIGYEMPVYEPPVCFTFGVRHERHPLAEGGDRSETLIPLGFGIGKRLGSARRLSLALFVRPEYLIRISPDPEGE